MSDTTTFSFLKQVIQEYQVQGEHRLPTVRELAKLAGVSTASVCKELKQFEAANIINLTNKKGILICDSADCEVVKAAAASHDRTEVILSRIVDDILRHVFAPGTVLPTIKDICARYGASYATVKQALEKLTFSQVLTKFKKSYKVYEHPSLVSLSRLLVIAHSDQIYEVSRYTPRATEFWRFLEMECVRLNIRLELCSAFSYLQHRKKYLKSSFPVLGFLVISHPMDSEMIYGIMSSLNETRLPVSVLDEMENTPMPAIIQNASRFKRVILGTTETAGWEIGQYLISLGHRSIACFSIDDAATWCCNRVNGLKRAFRDHGMLDAIKMYSIPNIYDHKYFTSIDLAIEPFKSMLHSVTQVQTFFDNDSTFENLALSNHAHSYIFNQYVANELRPLFSQALKDKNFTAWVPVTDVAALAALHFLRSQNVRIPYDISVVGFDDSLDAIGSGLTSYNFNVQGAVSGLIDHILRPPTFSQSHASRKWTIEIPGTVMARSSCAPPNR